MLELRLFDLDLILRRDLIHLLKTLVQMHWMIWKNLRTLTMAYLYKLYDLLWNLPERQRVGLLICLKCMSVIVLFTWKVVQWYFQFRIIIIYHLIR